MSLACSILKSAAIQLCYSTKLLRGKRDVRDWLSGALVGGRDASLVILKTHLMDVPADVRKEVGKTMRRHLNIGGAK